MSLQKKPSLSLNFLMNIILTMSSLIFPLITFPYISRVLLAEGNGKVQLATSVISYFLMIAQLGIPTYGIRVCAVARDDKVKLTRTVHELVVIQMVTMLLSYLLFFPCLNLIPKIHAERSLYLVTSSLILLNSIGMEWLFKAMEQYTYITTRSLVFKLLSIIAMFLLVHSKEDYVLYAGINVLASAGSYVMNLTQLPKYIDLKPVGGYQYRQHFKPVLILFAYVCATTIYTNLDSVMLGFMLTDADVGYYGVAVKIKNILVSVVTALGAVMLPRVSYYYEQGLLEKFWDMAAKAFRVVLMMAVPLAVYFMIFAKHGIFFLSGESYAPSIIPMVVIMPTLICIGLTSVTGVQILIPSKREHVVLYASIAGAVVDLILNALLIPSLRSTGAAIGTLVAEITVLVIQVAVLRKNLFPLRKSMGIGVICIASVVSGLASFWVVFLHASDFVVLAVSTTVFFGVYLLILHFCKEPFLMQAEEKLFAHLKSREKRGKNKT